MVNVKHIEKQLKFVKRYKNNKQQQLNTTKMNTMAYKIYNVLQDIII